MIPKTILFYWSKGAETRRRIIKIIEDCEKKKEACFLNKISQRIGLTHVATKKHIDLLIEEGYIKEINPHGKPVYLQLTSKGKKIAKEIEEHI